MKIAIFGGDKRMLSLAAALEEAGHSLAAYALPLGCETESPAAALAGAEAVVLPLPCAGADGSLFSPLSPRSAQWEDISDAATGTPVLAGKATAQLRSLCRERGLPLIDYLDDESLAIGNAALTAEGAIALILSHSSRSILGSRVLIYGFGRIGRALAPRLRALGAHVTVAARSPAARAEAESMGLEAAEFFRRGAADFVLNTVPLPHLEAAAFPGALCMELASPPYGFAQLGGGVLLASGLPGKFSPESAGQLMARTILRILEEKQWKN